MKAQTVPYCACGEWGEWHADSACSHLRFSKSQRHIYMLRGKKDSSLEKKKISVVLMVISIETFASRKCLVPIQRLCI